MQKQLIIDNIEYADLLSDFERIIDRRLSTFTGNNNQSSDDKLITRKEALSLLQVAPSTLYHLTASGQLKYIRHGRKMFFRQSDLMGV